MIFSLYRKHKPNLIGVSLGVADKAAKQYNYLSSHVEKKWLTLRYSKCFGHLSWEHIEISKLPKWLEIEILLEPPV